MKIKSLKTTVLALTLALSMVAPVATPIASPIVAEAAAKPVMSKSQMILKKGKSSTLKLKNATASKVKWKSGNSKIASVNAKGKVTGKKYGCTYITATYNGKKYECSVTVLQDESSKLPQYDFTDASPDVDDAENVAGVIAGTTWEVVAVEYPKLSGLSGSIVLTKKQIKTVLTDEAYAKIDLTFVVGTDASFELYLGDELAQTGELNMGYLGDGQYGLFAGGVDDQIGCVVDGNTLALFLTDGTIAYFESV